MIATIKSEWRKNRFRPAFLIGSGLMAAITVLFYSVSWYQATHPGSAESPVSILSLYPSNFVNNAMAAGFPLGAAMAIVLGAILSGSDYSWGTLKTVLTQGPGRLTTWTGRVVVFMTWMGVLTLVIFGVGAGYSAVIAATQNHAIVWPATTDIVKGLGAIWQLLLFWGMEPESYTLIFAILGFLLLVVYRVGALESFQATTLARAAFQSANALMSLSFVAAALITLSRLATYETAQLKWHLLGLLLTLTAFVIPPSFSTSSISFHASFARLCVSAST